MLRSSVLGKYCTDVAASSDRKAGVYNRWVFMGVDRSKQHILLTSRVRGSQRRGFSAEQIVGKVWSISSVG